MADLSSKTKALTIISAVEAGDVSKFDQAFATVDDDVVVLLEKFLIEVATGKYEVFGRKDSPTLAANPNYARAVLRVWRRVGNARMKMSARMAFESIISISRRVQ